MNAVRRAGVALLACTVLACVAARDGQADAPKAPRADKPEKVKVEKAAERAPAERTPSEAEPAGGRPEGMRWRPDSPMPQEMMDRIIAVAQDVSPDLAKQISERRTKAPDEMSQAMRQSARRLVALAVLKERNPGLYAIRVEDLRLQLELRALGDAYRAAVDAKDAAKSAALEAQIAAKVQSQVDVDLRARAQELLALDAQVQSMREDLLEDQKHSADRIAERVGAVKKGQPIQEKGMFGEGPGGERRGRQRSEGEADRAKGEPKAPKQPSNGA